MIFIMQVKTFRAPGPNTLATFVLATFADGNKYQWSHHLVLSFAQVRCERTHYEACTNCRNHKVECTFNLQSRKRPIRKDHKYIARIEERIRKLEAKLADAAPEAWAAFKDENEANEDQKSSGHGTGRRISSSRRAEGSDLSALTVSGAYLGTVPNPLH